MTIFIEWLETFRETPGFNDTGVVVSVVPGDGSWSILGIHKLTGAENVGKQNVFFDILDKDGNRDRNTELNWGWTHMRNDQRPNPVTADKPDNEMPNLVIYAGMYIFMQIGNGDLATGFTTGLPDGAPGNTWGHHSYYVIFQEGSLDIPDPPDPGPSEQVGKVTVKINSVYFNTLPVDGDGNVKLVVPIHDDE